MHFIRIIHFTGAKLFIGKYGSGTVNVKAVVNVLVKLKIDIQLIVKISLRLGKKFCFPK